MQLLTIISPQTTPYLNIAVEGALARRDTVVLYLWRNRRTVVIGRNQNPFAEVNLDALLAEGGFLARRHTGGGAVYHDEGNLNFSFIAPPELYDQERQFSVVCDALAQFGIRAEVSGRNDLVCQGRKVSGNAFSRRGDAYLHHGTLLIRTNISDLSRYLRPQPAKLLRHGVESVRSRVANLGDICPELTAESIMPVIVASFEKIYGSRSSEIEWATLCDSERVEREKQILSSEEWLYGRWQSFTVQRRTQFPWGDAEVCITSEEGRVVDVQIATDAIDIEAVECTRNQILNGELLV